MYTAEFLHRDLALDNIIDRAMAPWPRPHVQGHPAHSLRRGAPETDVQETLSTAAMPAVAAASFDEPASCHLARGILLSWRRL